MTISKEFQIVYRNGSFWGNSVGNSWFNYSGSIDFAAATVYDACFFVQYREPAGAIICNDPLGFIGL